MAKGTFCTVVNCMDGRTQMQVNDYLRNRYGVDHVDTVTEPGPNKILAEQSPDNLVKSILSRINISVHLHGSKAIAVIGHHDCTGNPVGKQTQDTQTARAAAFLKETYPGVEVIGLWVDESWKVREQ